MTFKECIKEYSSRLVNDFIERVRHYIRLHRGLIEWVWSVYIDETVAGGGWSEGSICVPVSASPQAEGSGPLQICGC